MFYKLYVVTVGIQHDPFFSYRDLTSDAGPANKRTIVTVFGTFYIVFIGMMIFAIIRKQFF